jgi:hypothetical protein
VERPVNGRLYRMAWLAAAVPLLAAAFTITRPAPLPPPAAVAQPAFDAVGALQTAGELVAGFPDRSPGSPRSAGAARWVRRKFDELHLDSVAMDGFSASIPGRGRTPLRNVTGVVPGRTRDTILVVAHRDSTSGLPSGDNNASGTAAMIELARVYAATRDALTGGASPTHTLVFASTDGGAYGLLGARRLASTAAAGRAVAVIVLDSIASRGRPRLVVAGHGPRSAAPGVLATAAARIQEETGQGPATTGWLAQLVDLAFPYSLTEQDEFLRARIPAFTITTGGTRPTNDTLPAAIDGARLGQVGRAAEGLIASLDATIGPPHGTNTFVYLHGRVIQGWAIALLYVAALVPFGVALLDLVARLRRRRVPLRPALRSYVRRLGFWLFAGALFYVFAVAGAWPDGEAAAVNPDSQAAGHWPRLALALYVLLVFGGWLVARCRLVRREEPTDQEELAGMAMALAALVAIAFVLIVTNIYALLFLLPSAHAWLWLMQARRRPAAVRAAVYVVGLAGPLILLGSFAIRFGLGLDAPWYLAELTAIGYVPTVGVVLLLAWAAVAGQIFAVATRRYSPYPQPAERPARGPVGAAVATLRHARQRSGHGQEGSA